MLTTIRNATGQLLAACEWVPCDDHGHPSNYGQWVWVNQLELSKGSLSKETIRQLIDSIATQMPHAVGAYWRREDTTGSRIHLYRRHRLLKEEVRGYVVA